MEGTKAIITGGDSGIGRAVAIAFAREGADVLISLFPGKVEKFGADNTMGRPAQPAELAPLYVFLASEESRFMTGAIFDTGGEMPPVIPGIAGYVMTLMRLSRLPKKIKNEDQSDYQKRPTENSPETW